MTSSTDSIQPRWKRALRTPLGQLIRGRIEPLADPRIVAINAGLPPNVAEVVGEIADRTRLWRAERADVARELVSHFRDGLDSGASAAALVESFGDPVLVARLIRRAKLRQRPRSWRLMRASVQATGGLLALAIVTYLWLAIRLFTASPTISRDYLREINAAAAAVPEASRAYPLYRAALLSLAPVDPPSNWSQIRAYVEANRAVIPLALDAARKPALGMLVSIEPDAELERHLSPHLSEPSFAPADEWATCIIGVRLSGLGGMRRLAMLLAYDTQLALRDGADGARIPANLHALIALSDHLGEAPTLIADLVAVAVLERACLTLDSVLAERPAALTDADLIGLSHHLAGVRGGGPIRVRIEQERVFFPDILQRLYTDDGRGNGRPTAAFVSLTRLLGAADISPGEKMVVTAMTGVLADRRNMLAKYDELMTRVEQESHEPLWRRNGSAVDAALQAMRESKLDSLRYYPLAFLFPSLSRASQLGELATVHRDATLTALAAELHRRRTGEYPATLEVLVPRYLPAIPIDRFDGFALRYRLLEGRPLIYSVGADGDDDLGRPIHGAREGQNAARCWVPPAQRAQLTFDCDGDWVLWPPIIDPIPETSPPAESSGAPAD